MRFTHAWVNVAQTNSFLKILSIVLTLSIIGLSIGLFKSMIRPPILIERGCMSKSIEKSPEDHTVDEIKAFIIEALKSRFNTTNIDQGFLSLKEQKKRRLEQKALTKQKMSQRLFIDSSHIQIDGDKARVQTDRLISVKDIRSAFIFNLHIEYKKVSRSKANPYGLILTKVIEIDSKSKAKKDV